MGRRAKTFITSETIRNISGYHTGFSPNIHHREFNLSKGSFTITDRISGPDHEAAAYLHFAPTVKIYIVEDTIVSDYCKINISGAQHISLEQYECAEGFNVKTPAPLVKIVFNKSLETIFESFIYN
jgi:hypothetical protein